MQLFKIVTLVAATAASLVVALPSPGGGARVEVKEEVDIKFGAKFYSSEGYVPTSNNLDYGDYSVPRFEFPPIDEHIRECAHRFGHDLHDFFHLIGAKLHEAGHKIQDLFHRLHEKLSEGWNEFLDKIHHKADCIAFKLHVMWRKLGSDAARAKFWLDCEALHFKHWYEYRERVVRGEIKIYTRFAHSLLCSLREFEARQKELYHRRYEQCAGVLDTYGQTDEDYITIVGRKDIEIDGKRLDLSLKAAIDVRA